MEKGGTDLILVGLINMKSGKGSDQSIPADIQNRLVDRPRDHGLAGYTKYANWCTGIKVNNFSDFLNWPC